MEKCQKREEGDVCAWTVENVLKTLRFSAIHLKAERRKRNLRRNLKTLFLMRTFFLQVFFLISFQNMKYLTWYRKGHTFLYLRNFHHV